MGESSKFKKSCTFKIHNLMHAVCLQNNNNFKLKWTIVLKHTGNKSEQLLYPRYEVYRGYIVFAFSVIMFVGLSVCWFVCLSVNFLPPVRSI